MEITYNRLAKVDNNEGYAAIMLCGEIGRDMYPTQLKKREFFFNEVSIVLLPIYRQSRS
jgi:hypothetical protein